MFTQEQLGALKGVVIEAIKPLEEKMDKRFDSLERKMDENLESHQEQIAKVSVQVTELSIKMERGFSKVEESIKDVEESFGPICKAIKDIRWDQGVIKSKMSIAEENKPTLFLRK